MPADGKWDMLVYYQPRPFLESYVDYTIEVSPMSDNFTKIFEQSSLKNILDDMEDGQDIYNSPE